MPRHLALLELCVLEYMLDPHLGMTVSFLVVIWETCFVNVLSIKAFPCLSPSMALMNVLIKTIFSVPQWLPLNLRAVEGSFYFWHSRGRQANGAQPWKHMDCYGFFLHVFFFFFSWWKCSGLIIWKRTRHFSTVPQTGAGLAATAVLHRTKVQDFAFKVMYSPCCNVGSEQLSVLQKPIMRTWGGLARGTCQLG